MVPHVSRLLQDDTHRLIPSAYDKETVLNRLTTDSDQLAALLELEGATNERLLGEAGLLPRITVRELVLGLSYSHIVNAAFTHPKPLGSRFNGPERGAWYWGFSLETAGIESRFISRKKNGKSTGKRRKHFFMLISWQISEGNFTIFVTIPVLPNVWIRTAMQPLKSWRGELLDKGSAGVVYPSVRHSGGTCIACFRPALVNNVRKGGQISVEFENAFAPPVIHPTT